MVNTSYDVTIGVMNGDDSISNPKKDLEFDRVYEPHAGQGEHNMCVFLHFL